MMPTIYSCASSGCTWRRTNSKERSRKNYARSARTSKTCRFVSPRGGVIEDEWTKVISGDRLVKFTYVDLAGGAAFLTAQIAGHPVVYSVVVPHAEQPFRVRASNITSVVNARQCQTDMRNGTTSGLATQRAECGLSLALNFGRERVRHPETVRRPNQFQAEVVGEVPNAYQSCGEC